MLTCPCHPLPLCWQMQVAYITLDLGTRPFTGIILCITVTFPGNVCPEVVRQQPEGNSGGGEDVEETAIGSPPENHSGPPGSTIDAAQLPPSWLIGRAGPLWQDMLSLLEEVWQEDWLLELAFLQEGQEEVCPAAA